MYYGSEQKKTQKKEPSNNSLSYKWAMRVSEQTDEQVAQYSNLGYSGPQYVDAFGQHEINENLTKLQEELSFARHPRKSFLRPTFHAPFHYGWEQPRIQTEVLGHSLIRSLVCSHRSLFCLLRPAYFAHTLRCIPSFTRSLTSITSSLIQYFRFKTFQTRALFWRAIHKSTTITICFSESPFLLVLLVRVSSWSDQLLNLKLKLYILQIFPSPLAALVA